MTQGASDDDIFISDKLLLDKAAWSHDKKPGNLKCLSQAVRSKKNYQSHSKMLNFIPMNP